ncbi:MAG: DUF2333 family protein [Chromatiaceae bacterium]|nr:MAG: DUF2333 family protein [Chromatiaceae bacterium]
MNGKALALGESALTKTVTNVFKYYDPRTWKERGWLWTAGLFLVTYLVIVIVLGLIWSRSPGRFDVRAEALAMLHDDATQILTGTLTTAVAIRIADTLLKKPGGYLRNDLMPPGVYLDNIPNWEFGALTALRDLALALRSDFSRAQSQSVEDKDLEVAQPQFNYNADSWMLPSTESEYRAGRKALHSYLERLSEKGQTGAHFFARADNLATYLGAVEKRLGSLAQRLSYAVGQSHLNTDLAGEPEAGQSTPTPAQAETKTPWLEIDDVFFEARGYTWALLHTLEAMTIDFAPVLEKKNALVSLQQINRELQNTQDTLWSPLILNGTGFGPMANHSLVMASYLSRANAAIAQLRELLKTG